MAANGFQFKGRLCKAAPTIRELAPADAAFEVGDLVNLESGKADLGATNDDDFLGVIIGPGRNATTDAISDLTSLNTTNDRVLVIVDDDAIYSDPNDTNARLVGAQLDISGATGAMTLAASSNNDVVVVAESTATQPTLFCINRSHHWRARL